MAVSLDDLDKLDPGNNPDIYAALAFLRLVVQNNPQKTAADLLVRPDVQSAIGVIDQWISDAEALVSPVITQSLLNPAEVVVDGASDAADALYGTLAGFRDETEFSDSNVNNWQEQDADEQKSWLTKLLLRMGWFVRFLAGLLGANQPHPGATTKTWVSRLASNTCHYCRDLHGVTIPLAASFAPYAVAAGFTKPYGGLYSPPLHPHCQCWLEFS